MNARMAKSLMCSLCLHLALSWWVAGTGTFRQGAARSASPALAVYLTANGGKAQQALSGVSRAPSGQAAPRPAPEENKPADKPSTAAPLAQAAAGLEPAVPTAYLSAGLLTRLPAPLTEVDLNAAEITETGFTGKIDLTILIGADGNVVDVVPAAAADSPRTFLDNVTARFKRTRFSPGEIDGKAVNAQLRITVVSERPNANGEQE